MSEITAQSNIQAARAARKRENLRAWTDKNRAYVNEQARLWYQAHKEEVKARRKVPTRREQQREYEKQRYKDLSYREQRRQAARAWRQKHLELARARARARYHANRDARLAEQALRRADPAAREKARAATVAWRAQNPEKLKQQRLKAATWRAGKATHKSQHYRTWYLRSKYGLTWEEYQHMLATQEYRCAICRSEFPPEAVHGTGVRSKWICVDHCHATERVRELLCPACNFMLGRAFDRPELLRAAADYLERHHARVNAAETAA
jgi:DNA-directed RNA polymerase subunit RPC12/RpoP